MTNIGLTPVAGSSFDGGGILKQTDYIYWNSPNTGATNEVGFNLRGSGYRDQFGSFGSIKINGRLISKYDNTTVTIFQHTNNSSNIDFFRGAVTYLKHGYPVRLVKDATSLTNGQTGTYIGNDGKVYHTICIGTQEWLSENLKETKYRDGSFILEITDNTAWTNDTTGALCAYNNDWSNVCTEGTTTTTTTTIAPTTTTTTTTECVRPQGLINIPLYRSITVNGVTSNFISTLELATQACYDISNTAGSSVSGITIQTLSFEVGSRVYYGLQTACIDVPDGYYLGDTSHQIIHIVGSYITEILVGCGYPATTTTTTTVASVTTTTTTIPPLSTVFVPDGFSPNGDGVHDTFDVYNLQYYPNNEMWIFYSDGGATIYHTTQYHLNPWNGAANNNLLPGKVPAGTYYYVLKINGATIRKSFVFVSY